MNNRKTDFNFNMHFIRNISFIIMKHNLSFNQKFKITKFMNNQFETIACLSYRHFKGNEVIVF